MEQRIQQQERKLGGRLPYAVHRIFLPYDVIKVDYPILKKHKWLLPFCYIIRWFKVLFRGRAGYAVKEMQMIVTAQKTEWQSLEEMFKHLGVDEKSTEA